MIASLTGKLPAVVGWLLALATALVVIGVVAAGLPRVLGLRAEAVGSRLRVPSLALAQAKTEVLPGDLVLFAGDGELARVYEVLALQRSGDRYTLIVGSPRGGEPLPSPVNVTGEVLVARTVLPLLGYGDLVLSDPVARWSALVLLAAALVALSFFAAKSRSSRAVGATSPPTAEAVPPAPAGRLAAFAPAGGPVLMEAAPVSAADDVPSPQEALAAPEATADDEAAAQQELAASPDSSPAPEVPMAPSAVGQTEDGEGLEGDLLAIFQKVASQVRERTLASEVEDVPMAELVEELRTVRRHLRP